MGLLNKHIPQVKLAFDKIFRPVILCTATHYYVLADESCDMKIAEAAGAKPVTPTDLIGNYILQVPPHLVTEVANVQYIQDVINTTPREMYQ